MADEKKKEVKVGKARNKGIYLKGQRVSTFFEAFTIGFTPIILIVFNFFIAISGAGLGAWLMPELPHAFEKIAIFTVAGSIAAMSLPSSLRFVVQCTRHLKLVKASTAITDSYKERVVSKIKGIRANNLFQALAAGTIMLAVHASMIGLMVVSFLNPSLMKALNVTQSSMSYLVIGIGTEVVSMVIDLFIGLTSNVRVDTEKFYPDLDEELEILAQSEQFDAVSAKFQNRISEIEENKKKRAKEKEEAAKAKSKTKVNPKTRDDGGMPAGQSPGAGGGNSGGPAVPLLKDLSKYSTAPEILTAVFSDTKFNAKDYAEKLGQASSSDQSAVSIAVASAINDLKRTHKTGSDSSKMTDQRVAKGVFKKAEKTKAELKKLFKEKLKYNF